MSSRRRAAVLACIIPTLFVGVGLGWVLAHPAGPAIDAVPSAAALAAAVVLFGLGAVPWLGVEPPRPLIAGFALAWLAAELVALWADLAVRAGVSVWRLGADAFVAGADEAPGKLVAIVAAAAVFGWAVNSTAAAVPVAVVAALSGLGIAANALAGHAGSHTWEPVSVVVHGLAAAWWCGGLTALAMLVRTRRDWAHALPKFSRSAGWAVAALAVTGVVSGVAELGVGGQWWQTGYGRVMLAKVVLLSGLLLLAGWHRRRWVPAVVAHRSTATTALRSAATEVAVMAVVLGLAAALATTSPLS